MPASLDMPQQMWLQGMISYRCTTEAHAKALHKAAVTACSMTYRAADYDVFMSRVAKQIGMVGLEIRRTVDEAKGTHIVGLVNTKGDEIAQMATTLSPHEITFVKIMIKEIVKAPGWAFCIGSKDALDIAAEMKPLIVASKAEALCNRLVKQGWLRLSHAGRYTLSPRSLMELQGYLKSTYEGFILDCSACEELMTNGSSCSNTDCSVHLHRHCLSPWERSLKKNAGGEKICTRCKKVWESVPVGEGILASQYASVRQARTRKQREQADVVSEDEEEEEEFYDIEEVQGGESSAEEEEEAAQASTRKRKSNGQSSSTRPRSRRRSDDGEGEAAGEEEEDEGEATQVKGEESQEYEEEKEEVVARSRSSRRSRRS